MSPSTNQERVTSFSADIEILQVDAESPRRDLAVDGTLSTPPLQLLPTLRFRPLTSALTLAPLKRRRSSTTHLLRGSQRNTSGVQSSLDKEKLGGVVTETAATWAPTEVGHAPLADGMHLSKDNQREPRQQPGRRADARMGRKATSGGRPSHWLTLKTISRIMLALGAGVLAVDLYLACWSSRAASRGSPSTTLRATQPTPAREDKRLSSTGTPPSPFSDAGSGISHHGSSDFGGTFGGPRPLKHSRVAETAKALSAHEGNAEPRVGTVLPLLPKGVRIDQHHESVQYLRQLRSDSHKEQRVAVVVPYARKELPVWWEVFAEHASLNEGLIDWLVLCNENLVRKDGPPNIKFFPTNSSYMAWLLAGVVEPEDQIPSDRSGDGDGDGDGDGGGGGGGGCSGCAGGVALKQHPRNRADEKEDKTDHESEMQESRKRGEHRNGIDTTAFSTSATASGPVDFVPTERQKVASRLHRLLLKSPSFIADFKPAFGWLFRDYLTDYTHWAFGELDVLFGNMRNGWLSPRELRESDILTFSHGDQHRAYMRGQLTVHKNTDVVNRLWRRCSYLTNYPERMEAFRVDHELPSENAKGCYGRAVASEPSLRVTFAVKATPSIRDGAQEAIETLGGQEVVISGHGLVTLCPDLGYYADSSGSIHGAANAGTKVWDETMPGMQDAVGPMTRIRQANISEKCEHWTEGEHQTCVKGVGPTQTLFLINGEYWKQEFINSAAATNAGKDCLGGAFYHFKEHKRNYRGWNSRPPVHPAHSGVAVGPGGIVPLPAVGWRQRLAGPGAQPATKHSANVSWYCLGWTERQQSREEGRTRTEQVCTVKVSSEKVVVVVDTRVAPDGTDRISADAVKAEAISMVAVGEPKDLHFFKSNADKWEGPKIFAMALDDKELQSTRNTDILNALKRIKGVLVVALLRPPPPNPDAAEVNAELPEKALMNLVSDLSESRYLFMLPKLSLVGHETFETVTAQLLHNRSASASSRERSSTFSPKQATKKRSRHETRAPETHSPVTLVVPVVTMLRRTRYRTSSAAEPSGGSVEESSVESYLTRQREEEVTRMISSRAAGTAAGGTRPKPPGGKGIVGGSLLMPVVTPVEGGWMADRAASTARQLSKFVRNAAGNASGRDGRTSGEEGGDEHESDVTATAEQEQIQWIQKLLMSGPTVPGLVVDMWTPGAMFLRHVEEFVESGCMDAGYALGLWAAGSNFELVEATLRSSALTSTRKSHSKNSIAFQAGPGGSEFRIPGGSCLTNDAVASTASIYSAFLSQVSNVYRHAQSGLDGREGRRRYRDHWDHLEDEEDG